MNQKTIELAQVIKQAMLEAAAHQGKTAQDLEQELWKSAGVGQGAVSLAKNTGGLAEALLQNITETGAQGGGLMARMQERLDDEDDNVKKLQRQQAFIDQAIDRIIEEAKLQGKKVDVNQAYPHTITTL